VGAVHSKVRMLWERIRSKARRRCARKVLDVRMLNIKNIFRNAANRRIRVVAGA
jgi:vacuolar-type H+-ATPase subunit E/Vma4